MYTVSVLTYAGARDLCGLVIKRVQIGCNANEEKYKGRCFKKCSLLTNGRYPLRKGRNTCSVGKGVLPYKTLKRGNKPCRGFAVNNKGRCPKIDISSRVPSSIIKC